MIGVFFEGRAAGTATPFVIGRHTHKAVPQAARPRAPATGVDYLGLLAAAHEEQAGTVSIDFSQLAMFEGDDEAGPVDAAPWVSHFGLNRTPFGKRIAAKDLFGR